MPNKKQTCIVRSFETNDLNTYCIGG